MENSVKMGRLYYFDSGQGGRIPDIREGTEWMIKN
jgi:hypothetical protein